MGAVGAIVGAAVDFTAQFRPRFAYKLPDNVIMYKLAKCDQNIPRGSRVMSIFTGQLAMTDQIDDRQSLVTSCIPLSK